MDSDGSGLRSLSALKRILAPLINRLNPLQRNLLRRPYAANEAATSNSHSKKKALDFLENIDEEEARMIRAIFKMEDTQTREIMVPRVDMVAADVDTPSSDLVRLMVEVGHSRIPLYTDTIEDIFGILHARDLLRLLIAENEVTDLRALARPSLFIPESKRLEDLLREFQEKHVTIAIVVDEHGGVAGLVTIEDLLEEIVGEIEDEFGEEEPEVLTIGENEAVLDARVSLDKVNELLSVQLEGDGFDTLGGMVYKHLGKIPSPGDKVKHEQLSLEVLSTIGRRIKKVRVSKEQRNSAAEDGEEERS